MSCRAFYFEKQKKYRRAKASLTEKIIKELVQARHSCLATEVFDEGLFEERRSEQIKALKIWCSEAVGFVGALVVPRSCKLFEADVIASRCLSKTARRRCLMANVERIEKRFIWFS